MADDAGAARAESAEPAPDDSVCDVADDEEKSDGDTSAEAESQRGSARWGVRLTVAIGLVALLVLGVLLSWLGYGAYQLHQAQKQRSLFLEAGRQAALNLTTVNYTAAEADVQRILDSATGGFYTDFQKRSRAFIDTVKQARSKSEGTITAAGLETEHGDRAQVLVAVTVKSSNATAADQPLRTWRMRIDIKKVGNDAKISHVEFVL